MHPTPVLLPGKSHGRRSLVGCSPWGHEESDTTERLHFDFSLSCIGEGIGNPLQCSCQETLRDGGAWWAAIYGVTQSRTRLKWLSSSQLSRGGWNHMQGSSGSWATSQFPFNPQWGSLHSPQPSRVCIDTLHRPLCHKRWVLKSSSSPRVLRSVPLLWDIINMPEALFFLFCLFVC